LKTHVAGVVSITIAASLTVMMISTKNYVVPLFMVLGEIFIFTAVACLLPAANWQLGVSESIALTIIIP
jgi:hypothetical protein